MDQLADELSNERARRAFFDLVPAEIAAECTVLLFRNGELRLYARRAAWATWLRNRGERLREGFADRRLAIARVTVRVAPRTEQPADRPLAKPLPPDASAAPLLRGSARSVRHPDLKLALERLARRLETRPADGSQTPD